MTVREREGGVPKQSENSDRDRQRNRDTQRRRRKDLLTFFDVAIPSCIRVCS